MISRRLASRFRKLDWKFLRVFALVGIFLVALDSCIALNRSWVGEGWEGFQDYQKNLLVMVCGFILFTILASRSKSELVGFFLFCVAIYYICNYEIGGPSKYSLTPFDPILGLERGEPPFAHYRRVMAYSTSILTGLILALAKLKNRVGARTFNTKGNENSPCSEKDEVLSDKDGEDGRASLVDTQ